MTTLRKAPGAAIEETLDPDDWAGVQDLSHQIIEDAVGYLRDIRDRPVWQDMPDSVKAFFETPLPQAPAPLADVLSDVAENVMSYPMGNVHPRFWSWYMGSGNFTGALGEFLAAIQGSNLGGGTPCRRPIWTSRWSNWLQARCWAFPATASGTLVSGGSMANIIGLAGCAER